MQLLEGCMVIFLSIPTCTRPMLILPVPKLISKLSAETSVELSFFLSSQLCLHLHGFLFVIILPLCGQSGLSAEHSSPVLLQNYFNSVRQTHQTLMENHGIGKAAYLLEI